MSTTKKAAVKKTAATAAPKKAAAKRKPASKASAKRTTKKAPVKRTGVQKAVSKATPKLPACLAAEAPYPKGNEVRRTFTAACALVAGLIKIGQSGLISRGSITLDNATLFRDMTNGRAKPWPVSFWMDKGSDDVLGPIAKMQNSFKGQDSAGYNADLKLVHTIAGYLASGKAKRVNIPGPKDKPEQLLILTTHPRSK